MKKTKKNIIEPEEQTFLREKNLQWRENVYIERKEYNWRVCSLFIFIFFLCWFFTLLYYIYSLKKRLKNENAKDDNKNINIDLNDIIIEPYIKAQKDFCENPDKYKIQKYEDEIFLSDVKLNDLKYQMYIFKSPNFILNEFKLYGAYEVPLSNYIIEVLKFYGTKNNILNNKDILMIDIGGNIGWYPSLLGRYGYTILFFEAFEKNYYVAKKNYCYLNKDSNVIIITKGLGAEEKNCFYFNQRDNAGNGMVICENKTNLNDSGLGKLFIKESEVEMTTLNTFMPYLSNKNIALMKIDVEGYELKVLEGGKELITKYHVPFVVLEFSPTYLKEVGSEPRNLAQFFVDNGYKISLKGFLSKDYLTVDELLEKTGFQVNCYFIYDSVVDSLK
jgi:FkbM family methyltransferase